MRARTSSPSTTPGPKAESRRFSDYLVNQAGKLGILSVFAAGNDSSDIDNQSASENASGTVHISSPYAIFVAASNGNNEIASYSNWDETDVDVAAPGSNILSTVATASEEAYYNVALTDDRRRLSSELWNRHRAG